MISSNGGSWSSHDGYYNNIIKSFKFYEEDIIVCDYIPSEKCILFTNQVTNEKYELDFEFIDDEEMHICIAFYYLNDSIQFLSDY